MPFPRPTVVWYLFAKSSAVQRKRAHELCLERDRAYFFFAFDDSDQRLGGRPAQPVGRHPNGGQGRMGVG